MSQEYIPDKWLLLEIDGHKKVLGGWSGGYLDGDSWRLSSAVENIEEKDSYYIFKNYSGSVYKCHKGAEGTTGLSGSILAKIQKECEENGIKCKIIEMEEGKNI